MDVSQRENSDFGQFWWVNQNQTHREEVAGGFMWSPKENVDHSFNQFYANMVKAALGDIVFSYYDRHIQQIGIVTATAETTPKPEFGPAGQSNNWSKEGWLVGVEYTKLEPPFRPKDNIEEIQSLLPDKYSPLRQNGDGLQGVYLAEISNQLGNVLLRIANAPLPQIPMATDPGPPEAIVLLENQALANIQGRTDIGQVEKTQLIKARRGQGIFRSNVRMNESRCRLTGIVDPAHLRASHIKPWRDCTDAEKVHGCNGLLLAPHVDHLFDRGWISFADDGALMLSSGLDLEILEAWGLAPEINVGLFSEQQVQFLAYHRTNVFRG